MILNWTTLKTTLFHNPSSDNINYYYYYFSWQDKSAIAFIINNCFYHHDWDNDISHSINNNLLQLLLLIKRTRWDKHSVTRECKWSRTGSTERQSENHKKIQSWQKHVISLIERMLYQHDWQWIKTETFINSFSNLMISLKTDSHFFISIKNEKFIKQ